MMEVGKCMCMYCTYVNDPMQRIPHAFLMLIGNKLSDLIHRKNKLQLPPVFYLKLFHLSLLRLQISLKAGLISDLHLCVLDPV